MYKLSNFDSLVGKPAWHHLRVRVYRVLVACVLYPGASALMVPFASAADDDSFCAHAQALIAPTGVDAGNTVHNDYEGFVESKVRAYPLQTQQYFSNPLPKNEEIYRVVSCKMRTAESIVDAYREAGEKAQAGDERSCDSVTADILDKVAMALQPGGLRIARESIQVDEEAVTFIGPMWLNPWPFEPAYTDTSGVLHLKSRALYVPWSVFIPAPAAFKGVYYCHLPAPAYLEALLSGKVSAPQEH